MLVQEGEPFNGLHVLLQGRLDVQRRVGNQTSKIFFFFFLFCFHLLIFFLKKKKKNLLLVDVSRVRPGALIGEMAFLGGGPSCNTVVAPLQGIILFTIFFFDFVTNLQAFIVF